MSAAKILAVNLGTLTQATCLV